MSQNNRKYLSDYQASLYETKSTHLVFELKEDETLVTSKIEFSKNVNSSTSAPNALKLDGENLKLRSIKIDNEILPDSDYQIDENSLTLIEPKDKFILETVVSIDPANNTSLEGLYKSNNTFCTQCEPNGFRKITYCLDRPDVMSSYTVKIIADKNKYPVILSNGDKIDSGELSSGLHYATWKDPFKKPSYLFALVAGDFAKIEEVFVTKSKRSINLEIYARKQDIVKCEYAMQSLKQAMKWDEERFDLEYDLDTYMVVAVPDFNSGAMENKGLNIFNTKFIMADDKSTTDKEFELVQGVVGHEYFHNWTGNRVTCRDWFQLGLKEGLTVFRDQEFTSDLNSRDVKRINDVKLIRGPQFAEDNGPMSHPVQPDSYVEMNNFFTITVYNKAAEVVRMLHTILGNDGFNKGLSLYFNRHDGQAVTFDQLVNAMGDANFKNLSHFKNWYMQSGTPQVTVTESYDDKNNQYTLSFKQKTFPTADQKEKTPVHVPVKMGLILNDGENVNEQLIELTTAEQEFTFDNISTKPVPSLFRDFSAPVKLNFKYSDTDLYHIIQYDNNTFNRWDALQQMIMKIIKAKKPLKNDFIDVIKRLLTDESLDKAFIAEAMLIPTESMIAGQMSEIMVDDIIDSRSNVMQQLGDQLQETWLSVYQTCHSKLKNIENRADGVGYRKLAGICLNFLMYGNNQEIGEKLALSQFENATNMTDQLSALSSLALSKDDSIRENSLNQFYKQWQNDDLVIDKWLSLQAWMKESALEQVQMLLEHPAYNANNPNKIYSLIGAFGGNFANFHSKDGSGYVFIADSVIKIDQYNQHIAARLSRNLIDWKKYDGDRQQLMKSQLERILASNPSKNVQEIIAKSLS